MSARYKIPAHLIQEWRKTCCEICGLIRYVLNTELLQQWQEGCMTVAYVFIKALIKLDVGRLIIIWYKAYWRHNIIEHSSLKVNSPRRWINVWTALHSNVADNDWSNIPHLSLQEKKLSIMGQYTSYVQASNMQTTVLYTLYKKTQAIKFLKLRNGDYSTYYGSSVVHGHRCLTHWLTSRSADS